MTSKATLRIEARKHRDRIDPASEDPDDIIAPFYESLKPTQDQIIALYWPKGREFDVRGLLEDLLHKGFICALPIVEEGSRILRFARWDETIPLIKGPFDLLQPQAEAPDCWVRPDIIGVPFLAFDRRGYRLGYGGGYYDTTLTALRKESDVLAVGLGYAQQGVIFNLPTEEHDVPLDWVITPQGAQRYK